MFSCFPDNFSDSTILKVELKFFAQYLLLVFTNLVSYLTFVYLYMFFIMHFMSFFLVYNDLLLELFLMVHER